MAESPGGAVVGLDDIRGGWLAEVAAVVDGTGAVDVVVEVVSLWGPGGA